MTPSPARLTVSWDVFDTVLTRRVGSTAGAALLLGGRLGAQGAEGSRERLAQARVFAEQHARRRALWQEPTLEAVHAELGPAIGVDPVRSMQAELDLERDLSAVLPAAQQLAAGAFAISDTVLPASLVRELLGELPVGQLLVSSQVGASKRRGGMWPLLIQACGSAPADVLHHGDDVIADLAVPRLYGVRTRLLREGRLNRYEAAWDAAAFSTGGLSSVFAGASRLARTTVPAFGPRATSIRDVTAGVAAPLLTAYVLWLLRRARSDGVQRLHFVSRDGQVLLDIARRLAPRLGLDVDLRYLSVSRRSVQGAPDSVRRYLLQEGLGERSGLVDVGWYGRQLRRVVELAPAAPAAVYLLGRRDDPTAWRDQLRVHAWMYDEVSGRGLLHAFPDSSTMVEAFCAATHGSVEGYDENGTGLMQPRRAPDNPRVELWGLPLLRQTVDAFVDALLLDPELADLGADVRRPAAAACELFWKRPQPWEGRAWGSFPWEENAAASCFTELARGYGMEDLRMRWQGKPTTAARRLWREGSLAISPFPVRAASTLVGSARIGLARASGHPVAQAVAAGLGARLGHDRDAPRRLTP